MAQRNSNTINLRIICDKNYATDTGSAVIEGLKNQGYRLLECSDPRPSRKNSSDVLVYLTFLKD